MQPLYVTGFLITLKWLIVTSQLLMWSCLMGLQMFSLLENFWKFTIQILQSCVGLNTLFPYFSMMFPKYQLSIRWFQLIRQYITCLAPEYITNLILYSNQNHINFTIGTLDYSVVMIPGWMVISLECTEICVCENNFLPHFLQLNSTLWKLTKNFPK